VRPTAAPWLIALLVAALPAQAEHRSISASLWSVSGRNVTLRLTVPANEARYLTRPGYPSAGTSALASYLLKHVSVRSDAGPCFPVDQGYDIGRIDTLSVGEDLYGFEVMFLCPSESGIVLHDAALFDVAPAHLDFARIASNADGVVTHLFTAGHEDLPILKRAIPAHARFDRYVGAGFTHILRSADRLCFLIGALLIARRSKEKLYILSGLSLGYAAAAAIAMAQLLVARVSAVEVWLAFMVAFTAALMIVQAAQRPAFTAAVAAAALLLLAAITALWRDSQTAMLLLGAAVFSASFLRMGARLSAQPLLWLVPTVLFGFLDGFWLPADLATLQLPVLGRGSGVIGFDIGAILADALLLGAMLLIGALLRKRQLVWAPVLRYAAATALAGLGSFWLVSRLLPWQ
jgi:hypothetical protein